MSAQSHSTSSISENASVANAPGGSGAPAYTTIAERAVGEYEEKKSRFIASLAPVQSEAEALAFLEEVRAANRMARHNVYAYVLRCADGPGAGERPSAGVPGALGDSAEAGAKASSPPGGAARVFDAAPSAPRIRYSDDGEPQKTAGLPTLQVLQHAGLSDVVAVVTRYFGGTLLGTGGLVRAYTQATQAAVAAARLVVVSRCVDLTVRTGYANYEPLLRVASDAGAKVLDTVYDDAVTLHLRMLDGTQEGFLRKLTEVERGQENVQVSSPFDAPF